MKKFIQIFLLFSRGKQIAAVVVGAHLLVLFALVSHHLITCRWRQPRPMIVRTLSPVIHAERKAVKIETGGEKQVAVKAPSTPAPEKKLVQQAKKEKTPEKIVATKPKGKPAPVQESVFKEIAESFEAINTEPKKLTRKPTLSVPGKVAPKTQGVEEVSTDDATYEEFLIAYLQNALDLPEYGEVRAKLEIDRFGRLIDCQIMDAKSVKNAQFLKNRLPELAFPCLNDFGIVDAVQTFTITFRNVEIR